MSFIKSQTLGIVGEHVWIHVDRIASVAAKRETGLATVFTTDGKTLYLYEKAEDFVARIKMLAAGDE